jgi:hypothetical protein
MVADPVQIRIRNPAGEKKILTSEDLDQDSEALNVSLCKKM